MSALGTATIAKLRLVIPPAGGWMADITLETGALPIVGARLVLTVGDLRLTGGVLRVGFDLPDQPRVALAGGPGWRQPTKRASFQSPNGVRLSTVLSTLAMGAANEPYDAPPDSIIGNAYGWPGSTPEEPVDARAVFAGLVRRKSLTTWRAAPSGRTRFDPWPALGAADNLGRIEGRDLAQGARRLALDTRAAGFLPGATVEGATIRRVIFTERAHELRAEVVES